MTAFRVAAGSGLLAGAVDYLIAQGKDPDDAIIMAVTGDLLPGDPVEVVSGLQSLPATLLHQDFLAWHNAMRSLNL